MCSPVHPIYIAFNVPLKVSINTLKLTELFGSHKEVHYLAGLVSTDVDEKDSIDFSTPCQYFRQHAFVMMRMDVMDQQSTTFQN